MIQDKKVAAPGPRSLPTRLSCSGCPALKTEDWTEYLENDETDRGTYAICAVAEKNISSYWNDGHPVPGWCPANPLSAKEAPATQPVGELTAEKRDAQEAPFEAWWEKHGQFHRAGGGAYEKTFAWHAWCAALSTRPELSDAEIDALRKKAARYEWLRDSSEPPHNFYLSVPVEFHGVRYQPSEVDAYIDAALAAARREKKE